MDAAESAHDLRSKSVIRWMIIIVNNLRYLDLPDLCFIDFKFPSSFFSKNFNAIPSIKRDSTKFMMITMFPMNFLRLINYIVSLSSAIKMFFLFFQFSHSRLLNLFMALAWCFAINLKRYSMKKWSSGNLSEGAPHCIEANSSYQSHFHCSWIYKQVKFLMLCREKRGENMQGGRWKGERMSRGSCSFS